MTRERTKIKPLRYINQGMETIEKMELLFSLTKVESSELQLTMIDHFVKGFDLDLSASLNFARQSHASQYIKRLNELATLIEKLNECVFYGDKLREVDTLVTLTGIQSLEHRAAIIQHLVYEDTISISASKCKVAPNNLSRNLKKLRLKKEFINDNPYIKFIQHK